MVPSALDTKGTQILAKSLFKELRGNGYSTNQILSLSTELIELVTQDLKDGHARAAASLPPPANDSVPEARAATSCARRSPCTACRARPTAPSSTG